MQRVLIVYGNKQLQCKREFLQVNKKEKMGKGYEQRVYKKKKLQIEENVQLPPESNRCELKNKILISASQSNRTPC